MEKLGYISGLLLGWCGLPQVIASIRSGHTEGLNKAFLWMWFMGELGMLIYSLNRFGINGPLLLNYFINITLILILLKYTYFPRTKLE